MNIQLFPWNKIFVDKLLFYLQVTQLIDPSGVFYLLSVGLLAAVILAVLEIVCLSCLQARRQKVCFNMHAVSLLLVFCTCFSACITF